MTAAPHPPWFTSRMPTAEECSIGVRLASLADADPDRAFLLTGEGAVLSRADVRDLALTAAGRLASLGVKPGDRVLVWLPTGVDMVRIILALSMLSATIVPLNTAMRGNLLAHMIALGEAEVLVCHPNLLPRLADIAVSRVCTVVVPGDGEAPAGAINVCYEGSLVAVPVSPALAQPWDLAAIIFSSGTTGPSKGVRVPQGQIATLAAVFYGYMTERDRMLLMYPLFHIAGLSALFGAVRVGGSVVVTEAFSASNFWPLVTRTGATTTPGLGPTFIDILNKPDPRPDDCANPLRHVTVQAISQSAQSFAARFGVEIMGAYSMSETSGICTSRVNDAKAGIVGRPRDGLEVRIVDENDIPVAVDTPGELIVRASLPWTLNAGYQANPQATATAWRNGWFHTGDIVCQDSDGDIRFVDRAKDMIRRRGENISSSEVEAEARQFPAVLDAAAIGVVHQGEDEVLIAATEVPGQAVDPKALIEFLIPRMPHFMVPRFVRILPDLPKTHTNRVQKAGLTEAGVTADSWDRESAGIQLRGQRLGLPN